MLNAVHAAPRIMYMRAFASLFAGRPSGLHVRNIILAAPRFNALLEDLNATIAEDFAAAREYVRVFEAVRMIHDHQLAWDKAAYESEVGFDARRVRLDLRKFRGWKAELDRMKVSQVRPRGSCLRFCGVSDPRGAGRVCSILFSHQRWYICLWTCCALAQWCHQRSSSVDVQSCVSRSAATAWKCWCVRNTAGRSHFWPCPGDGMVRAIAVQLWPLWQRNLPLRRASPVMPVHSLEGVDQRR